MFVPKSGQRTLYNLEAWMPEEKSKQMASTWAGAFQKQVLPHLINAESVLAPSYSPDKGAPNKTVSTLLGLFLLKELFNLSYAQVVEQYEFNLLWQHALDSGCDARISLRTLYNFGKRLSQNSMDMEVFKHTVDALVRTWKIKAGQQRIDSTQVISNMKILTRLGLFIKTIEQFLRWLKRYHGALLEGLGQERFAKRYLEREGYFCDPKNSQARRRLNECAQDVWFLLKHFEADKEVASSHAYQLLKRLFEEQCELASPAPGTAAQAPGAVEVSAKQEAPVELSSCGEAEPCEAAPQGAPSPPASELESEFFEGAADPAPHAPSTPSEAPIELKKGVKPDSLQNPSDPDATYSGHKGKGYQVQLAETCDADNPFQLIDYVELQGAHQSDQESLLAIEQDLIERGHKVNTAYSDTGYISGKNIVESEKLGVRLVGPMSGIKPSGKTLGLGEFEFTPDRSQIVLCPGGHAPLEHRPCKTPNHVNAYFASSACAACPVAAMCPGRQTAQGAVVCFSPEEAAIGQRRKEEQSQAFKQEYKIRSGIEATNSRLKNQHEMARVRVRGKTAVGVSVVFKALAQNAWRVVSHVLASVKMAAKALRAQAA